MISPLETCTILSLTITIALAAESETSGILLYLRNIDGSFASIDIHFGATIQELYLAPEIPQSSQLMCYGKALRRDDPTPLADVDILSESHIQMSPETDAVALYNWISNFEKKEQILWWNQAAFCADYPMDDECSVQAICQRWRVNLWQSFVCEGQTEEDMAITGIRIVGVHSRNINDRWSLKGDLSFQHLPKTLNTLVLLGHKFTDINVDELHGKALVHIDLGENEIESIDFRKFRGSAVQSLGLKLNHIRSINLADILGLFPFNFFL